MPPKIPFFTGLRAKQTPQNDERSTLCTAGTSHSETSAPVETQPASTVQIDHEKRVRTVTRQSLLKYKFIV